MSIIKLTDPRYCSPLDPPLIPTYPPPAGEGGERSPRISRERDGWKLGHAGEPTVCGFTLDFRKQGHATSAPPSVRITKLPAYRWNRSNV